MAEDGKDIEALAMVRILRLTATIQGIATGIVLGLSVFVATNWLVLRGGAVVGPHLALLAQFLVGYRVSFLGSLIGFAYGFVLGFLVGYAVAWIYNWLRDLRQPRVTGRG